MRCGSVPPTLIDSSLEVSKRRNTYLKALRCLDGNKCERVSEPPAVVGESGLQGPELVLAPKSRGIPEMPCPQLL